MDRTGHAVSYSADTIVIDLDDQRPPKPKDVVMQVLCEGRDPSDGAAWHRLMPDHTRTACGVKFNVRTSSVRREALTEPLCGRCFTQEERDEAARSVTERMRLDEIKEAADRQNTATFFDEIKIARRPKKDTKP